MKKQEKVFAVDNLTAKIKEAKAVILTDFRGLTMNQFNQLREKVSAVGGELSVVKNTLFKRALKASDYQPQEINGPTLALFAKEEETSPLKIISAFGKTLGLLPFKLGFMTGRVISAEELSRLASLPAKGELQARLVSLLANQPTRLVRSLNWNLQKLVLVLEGVKSKKQ